MSLDLIERIRTTRRRIHEQLRPNQPFIEERPPKGGAHERFMRDNDQVVVAGTAINTKERAHWLLKALKVPLGEDGLPQQETDMEAKLKRERASSWIDRNGDLVHAPPRARDCFGLPRFAKRKWKCDDCRHRVTCQDVVDARLTFGGRQQFDELLDENGRFNPINAGALGAISILRGWEPQLGDWRLRRDVEVQARWRQKIEEDALEHKLASSIERQKRKDQFQALVAQSLDKAAAEFESKEIEQKLTLLASSGWVRNASTRRALTDQFDRTCAVWKAEKTVVLAGKSPDKRGFVAEVAKAYATISGDSRTMQSCRSTVQGALNALNILREAGEDV
ncbi:MULTISPECIES: hypothetical protein [Oceanicaulis]|uniref:hypothetical protein n=1 Tax=Oceanicaulis TaxID=153232 RepID=UPI002356465E|nr:MULTISPECIES: hypothetical protein [Oceanicaulis]|tara:strand:- start:6060 stop:7067 length:1008 start_codon:yes stop_codon:yes gene_type:complete